MSTSRFRMRQDVAPYWYVIAAFLIATLALYVTHLSTGYVPSRAALNVFDFNIYWYGIIIAFGIGLGAFVVASLAAERARELFQRTVPTAVRNRPLQTIDLPQELSQHLGNNGFSTLGSLIYHVPFGPASMGLTAEAHSLLTSAVRAQPGVKAAWVEDAPWRQWNPEHVWNGLFWCLILAVIGARLYHVFTPSPSMAEVGINSPADYFRNPMQLLNLRRGGLGIYGGIAGGALGLLLYSYRHQISALKWADVAVVGVALGQFVGRWGNFFNQELYGRPTTVPWAVYIEPQFRLPGYTEYETFHPAFLYESLWNFLAFFILWFIWRRYRRQLFPGDIMAAYLVLYGLGRTLLETVRLDSRTFAMGELDFGLPIATVVSILVALAMIAWVIWRHRAGGPVR